MRASHYGQRNGEGMFQQDVEADRFMDTKNLRRSSMEWFLNAFGVDSHGTRAFPIIPHHLMKRFIGYGVLLNDFDTLVERNKRQREQAIEGGWSPPPLVDAKTIREGYYRQMYLILGIGAYEGAQLLLQQGFGRARAQLIPDFLSDDYEDEGVFA